MTKKKVHITPDGPKECSASIKTCTYAQNGGEHYDNMDDAQAAYDKQMKKEHGNFATKKTNAKTTISNIDNKNVTEYLKHSMAELPKDNIFREIIKGKNLKEIKENINNKYEEYKNYDRITKEDLINNIKNNNNIDDETIITVNFLDKNSDDYGAVRFTNITYQTTTDAEKELNRNEPLQDNRVLRDRKLYTMKPGNFEPTDLGYTNMDDFDPYDDYDAEDNLEALYNQEISYDYELTENEMKQLENQHKFSTLSSLKNIIDDPRNPDWMVLPFNKNSTQKYPSEITNRKIHNEMQQALMDKKEMRGNLKEMEQIFTKEVIDEYKENLKQVEEKIKKHKKEYFNNNKNIFEDRIAAHYPAIDPEEQHAGAAQWMNDNKDKLPNFNESSYYRE